MTGTFRQRCRSPPWATVAHPSLVAGVCRRDGRPGAGNTMDGLSVAPPVVRHRQQALDLMTGVRQGLQKVRQTVVMRTNPGKIIVEVYRCPTSGDGHQRAPRAIRGGWGVSLSVLGVGRCPDALGVFGVSRVAFCQSGVRSWVNGSVRSARSTVSSLLIISLRKKPR